jgi:hypothetical protein
MRKVSFEQACARFVHRYTMDHVPQWARRVRENGSFYAPQFASDREWYERTIFPGEPGVHGNSSHCYTSGQTWPLGQSLARPYRGKAAYLSRDVATNTPQMVIDRAKEDLCLAQ